MLTTSLFASFWQTPIWAVMHLFWLRDLSSSPLSTSWSLSLSHWIQGVPWLVSVLSIGKIWVVVMSPLSFSSLTIVKIQIWVIETQIMDDSLILTICIGIRAKDTGSNEEPLKATKEHNEVYIIRIQTGILISSDYLGLSFSSQILLNCVPGFACISSTRKLNAYNRRPSWFSTIFSTQNLLFSLYCLFSSTCTW